MVVICSTMYRTYQGNLRKRINILSQITIPRTLKQVLQISLFHLPLAGTSTLQEGQKINLLGEVKVIMAVGETKEQGLEAFIFINKYGNKLPAPFPAYMRLNSRVPFMNGLFYDNHYQLDAAHYSKKLQKKFSKLYKKASIREIEEE